MEEEKRILRGYRLELLYADGTESAVLELYAQHLSECIPVSKELADEVISYLAADIYNEWGL